MEQKQGVWGRQAVRIDVRSSLQRTSLDFGVMNKDGFAGACERVIEINKFDCKIVERLLEFALAGWEVSHIQSDAVASRIKIISKAPGCLRWWVDVDGVPESRNPWILE